MSLNGDTMLGAALLVEPSDWRGLHQLTAGIEEAGWDYAFCAEGPYAGNTNSLVGSTVLAENTSRVTVGSCISITSSPTSARSRPRPAGAWPG